MNLREIERIDKLIMPNIKKKFWHTKKFIITRGNMGGMYPAGKIQLKQIEKLII